MSAALDRIGAGFASKQDTGGFVKSSDRQNQLLRRSGDTIKGRFVGQAFIYRKGQEGPWGWESLEAWWSWGFMASLVVVPKWGDGLVKRVGPCDTFQ